MSRVLRWVALLGIATIAVMRCVIVFARQIYFDVDPLIDPSPLPAMSPVGSLTLDFLLLVFCALGLLGEVLAKRGIEWRWVLLAIVPGVMVLWHGMGDLGHMWRGSTWLAAIIASVTAAHLVRERAMRIVLLSLLLAVIAPLLVRGAVQMTVEHQATIETFEHQKDAFLADRGWSPDSPAAQIYERRLRDAAPTGWFTTTNIYAAVMAVGVVLGFGLLLGSLRGSRGVSTVAVAAGLVACAGVGLVATGSKGAIGAAGLGVLFAVALNYSCHAKFKAGWIAIGLIAVAFGAIIVRGLLWEGFAGEKSLLFRWHYLQGAARIIAGEPLTGVGPDNFQTAYMLYRPARSPEEVISAHSVFTDWIATLGVVGMCWIVLIGWMVLSAGRAITERDEKEQEADERSIGRVAGFGAIVVIVTGLIPAIAIEIHSLGGIDQVARGAGIVAYLLAAVGFASLLCRVSDHVIAVSALAAATTLLMQSQVEMTMFMPGSIVLASCVLGASCRLQLAQGSSSARTALFWAVCPMLLAALVAMYGWMPARTDQHAVAKALQVLTSSGDPLDSRRRKAGAILHAAVQNRPVSDVTIRIAAEQLMRGIPHADDAEARKQIELIGTMLDLGITRLGRASLLGMKLQLRAMQAERFQSEQSRKLAILAGFEMARADPRGIRANIMYGDLLWDMGERSAARELYAKALANSDNFELDPLKQLSASQRERLESRLAELEE